MRTKDSGTDHILANLRSTLYKLTGWLASLDLAAPTQRLILSHRTASPHALYDVLVLDGGRGATMNDLVDSDCELPVNLVNAHKLNRFSFWFLVFGLLCRHTASNSITSETAHNSGA